MAIVELIITLVIIIIIICASSMSEKGVAKWVERDALIKNKLPGAGSYLMGHILNFITGGLFGFIQFFATPSIFKVASLVHHSALNNAGMMQQQIQGQPMMTQKMSQSMMKQPMIPQQMPQSTMNQPMISQEMPKQ